MYTQHTHTPAHKHYPINNGVPLIRDRDGFVLFLQLHSIGQAVAAIASRRQQERKATRRLGAEQTYLTMYGVGELGVHAIDFHPRPSGVDTVHASWVPPMLSATRDCDLHPQRSSRQLQARQWACKRYRRGGGGRG